MTTAKEWIALLQEFDPDEEVIAMVYNRELFGNEALVTKSGDSEYPECPKEIWDKVACEHQFRDWINEQVYEDIRLDLQDAIDAKGGE